MSHSFLTIAMGDEKYYKMATNLLQSYRYFSKSPLPFAILADRENEYTAKFDDVMLLENAHCNYLDKLSMLESLPYDVNIFIDADCIAYGDLNKLFDMFKDADDFSCFGRVLPLNDKTGWFEYENLGELKQKVSYVVGLHGGVYYMRKSKRCDAVAETAKALVPRYKEYSFKGNFATPGDEPLIALSMALNDCKPIPHDLRGILCYWEYVGQMRLSITDGVAAVKNTEVRTDLLHWGTRFTITPLYRKQIADLRTLENGGSRTELLLNSMQYGAAETCGQIDHFIKRALNKLKRIFRIK